MLGNRKALQTYIIFLGTEMFESSAMVAALSFEAQLDGSYLGFPLQVQSDDAQGSSHLKTQLSWRHTPMSGAPVGMAATAGDWLSILVSPQGRPGLPSSIAVSGELEFLLHGWLPSEPVFYDTNAAARLPMRWT